MKILSLRVEQFRKFDQPVLVDGFGDGLNLIAGPNETGKSTLLLALRAALFERHGTRSQAVKDFAPHHVTGARPTVTLAFEIGGERYVLEKSFLKRPAATLETAAGRRFEGSDAEEELKRLLGLNPSEKTPAGKEIPAHFGVLMTPQAASFQQPALAGGTRHSLEAAIAYEIVDLGNQSEADGLLAAFDAMMGEIVYKRGAPRGRYEEVTDELKQIERDLAEAGAERDLLRDQFTQLERAIARRSELQAAESPDDLSARLAALEVARQQAAHCQSLDNRRLAAEQRLQKAEARRTAHRERLERRRRLAAEIDGLDQEAEDTRRRLGTLEDGIAERTEALAGLGERRDDASRKQRDLEKLGRQVERLQEIEATLRALATDVRLELEASTLDRVTLDGVPVASTSELRQVTEGLTIQIEGVGRIGIEPKIEPMREALDAKARIEREIERFMQASDLGDTAQDTIEAAWQAIADETARLEAAKGETETALAEERDQAADVKVRLEAACRQRDRQAQQLAEIDAAASDDAPDEAALDAEIVAAGATLKEAEEALRAAPQGQGPSSPPVVETIDEQIADLRAGIERRRHALDEVNREIIALESAIDVRAGRGLDDKIDQLERRRHLKGEERDAFDLEHRALSLLQTTLRAAADEARANFNAPLEKRLTPYIRQLLPNATPVVTSDFSISDIDRGGTSEPYLQLSDGTREQIAILARLAFADMLQDQGLPALIILDDALAFSDDRRFERMIAILEKAALRMQVIILTCREDRFAGIAAKRLSIMPASGRTSSAA